MLDSNSEFLRAQNEFAKRFPSVAFVLQNYWATQNSKRNASIEFVIDGAVLSDQKNF